MLSPLRGHSFFDADHFFDADDFFDYDPLFKRVQRLVDSIEKDLERNVGTLRVGTQDGKTNNPAIEEDKKNENVAIKEGEKSKNDEIMPHEVNKSNTQITLPSLFGADSFFKRTHQIVNSIQRDMENHFNKTFDSFKALEQKALEDPEHTWYYRKSKVDNNGHVCVETVEKEPNSDWKRHVEEYDYDRYSYKPAIEQDKKTENVAAIKQDEMSKNDVLAFTQNDQDKKQVAIPSLFDQTQLAIPSLFNTGPFFERSQWMIDNMKRDIENHFNKTFDTFKALEHKALEDPEHTWYYRKSKVDNNGHVRVETVEKEPNSDWKRHVEEYDRSNTTPVLKQDEKSGKLAIKQDSNMPTK